jgi:hypothetical protein
VAPVDGDGRCPIDATGIAATLEGTPIPAGAAVMGKLKIPNLGPNRYAVSVVPPNGTSWVQTTTLEGNLDWDNWVMEGATGLDQEFVQAGEPFPWSMFGYVKPTPIAAAGAGVVKGVVDAVKVYVPAQGGVTLPGTIWGGLAGAKIDKPVPYPWIALTGLQVGDVAIYVGQGNADGSFQINGVPDGNYTLTYWDTDLRYLLDFVNVTVANGEVVDLGILPLTGWFATLQGYVFNDLNRNGKRDTGEAGIANFPVSLKKRENSLMDRGAVTVTTDANGYYEMTNAYPLTQWVVVEAYSDLFYTTGVTWQADNQPDETTILGAGVDVSFLPIIGLAGRLDWGVHAYDPTGRNGLDLQNGGIVGTVSYDTTRNELDPRYAAVENWQPGIPDLWVNLYLPVPCPLDANTGLPTAPCDASGRYQLASDGSIMKGQLLNRYLTETWARPTGCQPRDIAGNPLTYPAGQQAVPNADPAKECLEGPLMGIQFQAGFSTVDGNYGFADGCFGPGGYNTTTQTCDDGTEPTTLTSRDYLVEVEDKFDARGRPMFQVTREEDINIFNGDQWVPQIPPPECAGPLHIVDNANVGTDSYPAVAWSADPTWPTVTVGPSTPVANPAFADAGGSVYEGQVKPLCNVKLVRVSNGRSIAPTFNYFTDVPLPGRFFAYIIDDLNFSANPQSLLYGEKAGIPHIPIGIYDYTRRLVTTVESDYNGLFDVLLPSTNRISCPTPSGVCANLFRLVGNDPGIPGRLNPNFNPQYRTIAADFEVFPGLLVPADLAPTQVGVAVQLPGSTVNQAVTCALDATEPQLYAVGRPWVRFGAGNAERTISIQGVGFGTTPGQVTLDDTVVLTASGWTDTSITALVPTPANGGPAPGPHQLKITGANGKSTVNGLTIHVKGAGYGGGGASAVWNNPSLFEVGPGRTYATIQAGLDAAAGSAQALVVVYPGTADQINPRGAYYENVIITTPVKLQGVGPGGFQGTTFVPGSIVDGSAFGGDTALADAWRTRIAGLTWDGNQTVYENQTIYVLTLAGRFGSGFKASIDGLDIRGGDQQGFPVNINEIGGTPTGLPQNTVVQGGGIFVNAYGTNLQITNNVLQNNSGTYAGAIRLGTPNLPAPNTSNHNENTVIAHNRIVANGGSNLAGAIGIFAGTDGYEVAHNDICGNFSAEYGGGIGVYGLSPGGRIHHNRIWFNRSYDEGGGIMIAGQLPADPATLSPGTGPVDIYANRIQANLANDDGGGIRFLMAGNFPMNVYNNFVVNNVSTHEGGGISLNDAPAVRIFNNTIMKNITTATAVTSNGLPMPAGLSTSQNSAMLQATLPAGSPSFSDPVLFNNVFWDNRAGTRGGGTVTGIGIAGDATPVNNWDLGVADSSQLLSPTSSVLQTTTGTNASPSNVVGADPQVVATYDTSVAFAPWRTNPAFVGAILVAVDLPPNLMGDYHLVATGNPPTGSPSPAFNLGAASKAGVSAPGEDYDRNPRPQLGGFDAGADEVGSGVVGGGGPGPAPLAFPSVPPPQPLDNFNRANAATLGPNWTATGTFNVNANQARIMGLGGLAVWNPTSFGPNQEAYFTFVQAGAGVMGLALKSNGTGASASRIEVIYTPLVNTVQVRTIAPVQGTVTRLTINLSPGLSSGHRLGARLTSDGTVTVYRATSATAAFTAVGSVNVASGATPWPAAYVQGGGQIGAAGAGLFLTNALSARFDNFGGGTMP